MPNPAPSNAASALSNSLAVTINAGDFVIVMVNNQDNTAPDRPTDDASGGTNIYARIRNDSDATRGNTSIYVCFPARAATTISFTAGHRPSIAALTITNTKGPATNVAVQSGGNNNPINQSLTTIVDNALVVCLLLYINTTTPVSVTSATTGTLQTSVGASTTVSGIAIVTESKTPPGSITLGDNLSGGTSGWAQYSYEFDNLDVASYAGALPDTEFLSLNPYVGNPIVGSGGTSLVPIPVAQIIHDGTTGTAYSETISAVGGTSPYTFSLLSGSLPTGLSMTSGGLITGTPTVAGTYTFTIQVTDSVSNTGSESFTINIATPPSSGGGSWVF